MIGWEFIKCVILNIKLVIEGSGSIKRIICVGISLNEGGSIGFIYI